MTNMEIVGKILELIKELKDINEYEYNIIKNAIYDKRKLSHRENRGKEQRVMQFNDINEYEYDEYL